MDRSAADVSICKIFAFALVMSNIAGVPLGEFGSIRDLNPTEEVVLLKVMKPLKAITART